MKYDSISEIGTRRQQFFEYFRDRLKTATRSDLPKPDRLVLLTASLAALSDHWHATADRVTTPAQSNGLERMRLFLVRHGAHPAFEKVSAPMFRNATGREVGTFPFASYQSAQVQFNEVRNWEADPNFSDLESGVEDRNTLLRWSYGGILYVDFRCAWMHKLFPENEDIVYADTNNFDLDEPYYRYQYSSGTGKFLLVMPVPFLSATLNRAIESFEREAETRNILPLKL